MSEFVHARNQIDLAMELQWTVNRLFEYKGDLMSFIVMAMA